MRDPTFRAGEMLGLAKNSTTDRFLGIDYLVDIALRLRFRHEDPKQRGAGKHGGGHQQEAGEEQRLATPEL